MTCVYRIPNRTKGALLTPCAKQQGYQVTWFDERGFWGDTVRQTIEAAVQEITSDGYVPCEREFFDALCVTEAWAAGMRAAAEVAKFNARFCGGT
jgi:hypothetical protein